MATLSTAKEAAFVACNIYISSASSTNSTLENLLKRAQNHCRSIRDSGSTKEHSTEIFCDVVDKSFSYGKPSVAIIHAFADIPYNRSSFHLAGRSDCVADVALSLILNSFDEIDFDITAQSCNSHPFVGLIDHVSVMPMMSYPKVDESTSLPDDASGSGLHPSQVAAITAARAIGTGVKNAHRQLTNVHYYGLACPENTPLAQVRREKTEFFTSREAGVVHPRLKRPLSDNCTIGVPHNFVENYNIRLSSNVDFAKAKTLTQFVRGRNIATKGYGVEGVEALTLPYQMWSAAGEEKLVYEVACNLTNPSEGSVLDIEEAVEKWIEQQDLTSNIGRDSAAEYFIDKMYRVGTIEKQCIDILMMGREDADSGDKSCYWKEHDERVLNRFRRLLKGKECQA